ncbi:MAG: DNA translocase FtsK 4TM domain-containing protein [Bacteroidota bacterium]
MSEAGVKGHAKIKDEAATEEKVKDEAKAPKKLKLTSFRPVEWLREPRNQKIIGAVLLFTSLLFFFSFASFLFTWKEDQSLFSKDAFSFFDRSVQATNWLGKLGAWIAYVFVNNLFGVASFLIVLNLFVVGFRLVFDVTLIKITSMLKNSLFLLLFTSTLVSFVLGEEYLFLGGALGFELNQWLNGLFGILGNGFLIVLAGFLFVVIRFNPDFSAVKAWFAPKEKPVVEPEPVPLKESKKDLSFMEKLRNAELVDDEDDDIDAPEPFLKEAGEPIPEPEPEEVIDELPEEQLFFDEVNPFMPPLEYVPQPEPEPEPVPQPQPPVIPFVPIVEEIITADGQSLELTRAPEEAELSEKELKSILQDQGEYDPTLDLSSYQFPTLDLLEDHGGQPLEDRINKEELLANQKKIVETLGHYKIDIEKIKASIGPTVTLYEIIPAPGIRISKIQNLENDIALSLAALGIRIIAPIPGKGTIGIEVPNTKSEIVPMKGLLRSDRFAKADMDLPIALGKTISNETFVVDLAKMPHLLMAGATGQGKSVGLNAILVSLLYKKHPSQIKFVLVDPKKVELTLFNKIERHFLAKLPEEEEAIITDTSKVVRTLNSLCIEMDNRYELLKNAQVRNIKEYNKKFVERRLNPDKGHLFLPYIVVVVDEFADLIMTAGKEVEMPIARIAQLARAVGIHLIIATQRPSVNIITGVIKANFPARIAFRVSSKIDSRTILDTGGADQLIGRGDMLYSNGNDLIRIQCGFVDTPEVERITEFIGNQRGYISALLLPEVPDENGNGGMELEIADRDDLFDEAAKIVVQHQQGSASLLQRKLQLGYNRAGRLIDQLEAAGIVGPFKGSKAREVLYSDLLSLEQFLTGGSRN